jgi:hypothetical protein
MDVDLYRGPPLRDRDAGAGVWRGAYYRNNSAAALSSQRRPGPVRSTSVSTRQQHERMRSDVGCADVQSPGDPGDASMAWICGTSMKPCGKATPRRSACWRNAPESTALRKRRNVRAPLP